MSTLHNGLCAKSTKCNNSSIFGCTNGGEAIEKKGDTDGISNGGQFTWKCKNEYGTSEQCTYDCGGKIAYNGDYWPSTGGYGNYYGETPACIECTVFSSSYDMHDHYCDSYGKIYYCGGGGYATHTDIQQPNQITCLCGNRIKTYLGKPGKYEQGYDGFDRATLCGTNPVNPKP